MVVVGGRGGKSGNRRFFNRRFLTVAFLIVVFGSMKIDVNKKNNGGQTAMHMAKVALPTTASASSTLPSASPTVPVPAGTLFKKNAVSCGIGAWRRAPAAHVHRTRLCVHAYN